MAAINTNNATRTFSSLDHAWNETVSEWENPKSHDELLRVVRTHSAWVWAARRYREYLDANPGNEIAQKNLTRIERASFLLSVYAQPTRERRAPNPYRKTISILTMLVLALGFGTAYTSFMGGAVETDDNFNDSIVVVPADQPTIAADDDVNETDDESRELAMAKR